MDQVVVAFPYLTAEPEYIGYIPEHPSSPDEVDIESDIMVPAHGRHLVSNKRLVDGEVLFRFWDVAATNDQYSHERGI